MTIARQEMARRAEQHVARHLEGQGFRIVGMNVRAGRLELDVVAERAGLLVVCDPRMAKMPYGRRLIAALPPMSRVVDEPSALAWLAELAAAH